MPKPKHHDHEDDYDRGSQRHEDESGDDPRRHATIIERRWQGSAPPTVERYARALQQWQALPGAVVRPAAAVAPPAETPEPEKVYKP
jgi:hypothetical protein